MQRKVIQLFFCFHTASKFWFIKLGLSELRLIWICRLFFFWFSYFPSFTLVLETSYHFPTLLHTVAKSLWMYSHFVLAFSFRKEFNKTFHLITSSQLKVPITVDVCLSVCVVRQLSTWQLPAAHTGDETLKIHKRQRSCASTRKGQMDVKKSYKWHKRTEKKRRQISLQQTEGQYVPENEVS